MANYTYTRSKIKCPCVPNCPGRSGHCRETCEKHKKYAEAKAAEWASKTKDAETMSASYNAQKSYRLKKERRKGK